MRLSNALRIKKHTSLGPAELLKPIWFLKMGEYHIGCIYNVDQICIGFDRLSYAMILVRRITNRHEREGFLRHLRVLKQTRIKREGLN